MGSTSTLHAPDIDRVLAIVADARGLDFRDHRREPLVRAVVTRLEVLHERSLGSYEDRLLRDPGELDRLIERLVTPVSGFFRDAKVWDALSAVVLPDLVAAQPCARLLRAWVAGAATGEEAWSLAIAAMDARERRGGGDVDVVASDVDDRSLAIARRGVYGRDAVAAVPEDARVRHFLPHPEGFEVGHELRSAVLFARHDLTGPAIAPCEAVVAAFEVVSLRNVLIYFERRLQQKVIERIVSILRPGGVLVLGSCETLPLPVARRFETYPGVDRSLPIFRHLG